MDLAVYLILTIAAFFTSVISALVGMAGGIVLLSVMTFFMELQTLVPIHGVVQLASNGTRTFRLLEHVEKRIFIPTLVGMPVGTWIGTELIVAIERRELFYFLVAGLIFYVLFKPKRLPPLKIPFWSFGVLAFLVGILNPLVGATGPFMAPFYLRDDLSKEQIVATKASAQTFGHLLKIPAFLYLGFDYAAYGLLILLMTIGVVLGTNYGVGLLKGMQESTFRLIYRSALFVAGVRVLYKATQAVL